MHYHNKTITNLLVQMVLMGTYLAVEFKSSIAIKGFNFKLSTILSLNNIFYPRNASNAIIKLNIYPMLKLTIGRKFR